LACLPELQACVVELPVMTENQSILLYLISAWPFAGVVVEGVAP
jgi:hypothetical protein